MTEVIAGYRVGRSLGRGAVATVFETSEGLALERLNPVRGARSPLSSERFVREAPAADSTPAADPTAWNASYVNFQVGTQQASKRRRMFMRPIRHAAYPRSREVEARMRRVTERFLDRASRHLLASPRGASWGIPGTGGGLQS